MTCARELLASITRDVAASLIQHASEYDLCDARMARWSIACLSPDVADDEWDWDRWRTSSRAVRDQVRAVAGHARRVASQVWPVLERRLAEREKELSRAWLMHFQRQFSLTEIDEQWNRAPEDDGRLARRHRPAGYGQKDPKKEYKKIGFDLFREMMDRIQANT